MFNYLSAFIITFVALNESCFSDELIPLFDISDDLRKLSSRNAQGKTSYGARRTEQVGDREISGVHIAVAHYEGTPKEPSIAEQIATDALTTGGSVSAHYLVCQDGRCKYLVDETMRAWHAGESYWRGMQDINSRSIGVEIVNRGYARPNCPADDSVVSVPGFRYSDWFPYSQKQVEKVADMFVEFRTRYQIEPVNFVGHSDIAPGRKQDPGPLFPWKRLHNEYCIGAWYDTLEDIDIILGTTQSSTTAKEQWMKENLAMYGYNCEETSLATVVQKFQMHFRPSNIAGSIDDETIQILYSLLSIYKA